MSCGKLLHRVRPEHSSILGHAFLDHSKLYLTLDIKVIRRALSLRWHSDIEDSSLRHRPRYMRGQVSSGTGKAGRLGRIAQAHPSSALMRGLRQCKGTNSPDGHES